MISVRILATKSRSANDRFDRGIVPSSRMRAAPLLFILTKRGCRWQKVFHTTLSSWQTSAIDFHFFGSLQDGEGLLIIKLSFLQPGILPSRSIVTVQIIQFMGDKSFSSFCFSMLWHSAYNFSSYRINTAQQRSYAVGDVCNQAKNGASEDSCSIYIERKDF